MKGGRSGARSAGTSDKKKKKVQSKSQAGIRKLRSERSDDLGFLQWKALCILTHPKFDIAIGVLIILNALCLGIETDVPEPKAMWQVIEQVFCCLFVGELVLRVVALRIGFLQDLWCIFDSLIVGVSLFDVVMTATGSSSSLRILTILRILRLLRLARMIRLVRMFKALYLVLQGISGNAQSMLWIGCLLLLTTFTFSVFTTRIVGHDEKWKGTEFGELFSTVGVSMFSYFVLMTFDDWYNAFVVPVLHENTFMAFVFIAFLMFTAFSILNVLCALVVSSTLDEASEQVIIDGESDDQKRQQRWSSIEKLFAAKAGHHGGAESQMSLEEFQAFVQECPEVCEELNSFGIDLEDIQKLFDVLDLDGGGYLEVSELVNGCDRLCDRAVGRDLTVAQQELLNQIRGTEQAFNNEIQAENERWEKGCAKLDALETSVEKLLEAVERSNRKAQNGRADVAGRLDRLSKHLQRSLVNDANKIYNDAVKAVKEQQQEGTLSKCPEIGNTMPSTPPVERREAELPVQENAHSSPNAGGQMVVPIPEGPPCHL